MLVVEILLSFVDVAVGTFEIFDARRMYRVPIRDYRRWREENNLESKRIYQLKKQGYLEKTRNDFRLTKKAIRKIQKYNAENLKIKKPDKWDGCWRIITFDIPEKNRYARQLLRDKLKLLGFIQLQKSVFCHPYDCVEAISLIGKTYEIEKYITYFCATEIITTKNIYRQFGLK